MKKMSTLLFLASIVFVLASNNGFAQFKLKVGPAVGLNFNIASGDRKVDTYTGIGMLMGAQLDMALTPMIGLITNINFYDNKSHSTTTTDNDVTTEEDYSLAYFTIEPLFKLTIPKSGFYFFTGPSGGFNIQKTFTTTTTQGDQTPTTAKNTLKNLAFRFGLKIGSGFDINAGSLLTIAPEFSFSYGITDVFSTGNSWKIMTINLSTIVKFSVL